MDQSSEGMGFKVKFDLRRGSHYLRAQIRVTRLRSLPTLEASFHMPAQDTQATCSISTRSLYTAQHFLRVPKNSTNIRRTYLAHHQLL